MLNETSRYIRPISAVVFSMWFAEAPEAVLEVKAQRLALIKIQ